MRKKFRSLFTAKTLSTAISLMIAICFYMFLSNFKVVETAASSIFKIVSPFIGAFVIAYILNSPVNYFEEKIFYNYKYKKMFSIVSVYILSLLCFAALMVMVLPQAIQSAVNLITRLPEYSVGFGAFVQELFARYGLDANEYIGKMFSVDDLVLKATDLLTKSIPKILDYSYAVGSSIVQTLMAIIVSIYMLVGKTRLIRQCKKLMYALFSMEKSQNVLRIAADSNKIFSGFIVGKLIDSLIIGLICFIGTTVLQLPYAVLISVVVGITNIIPFFGPIIGAIPCVLILLIVNPWDALWFSIFVLLLQQFDGNILGPKILGDSTGLSAIWVLVAIVIGGGLFGFTGMILGVPTFAVIYHIISEYLEQKLREKGIDAEGESINNMLEQLEGIEEKETQAAK